MEGSWVEVFMAIVRGSGKSREVIPLNKLLDDIGIEIAQVLPGLHSLSGCDTVSKVGSKTAILKYIQDCTTALIQDFGKKKHLAMK